MDIKQLVELFFDDEEVRNSFRSIWGTVDGGMCKVDKFSMIEEFNEPLQRICDYINTQQEHICKTVSMKGNSVFIENNKGTINL